MDPEQNRRTDKTLKMVQNSKAQPGVYIGLRAIGEHMGWSAHKVFRMHCKYHFPLVALPHRTRWAYQVTDDLIARWWNLMAEHTRQRSLQSPAARRLAIREEFKASTEA
jgi:hypothetical protein